MGNFSPTQTRPRALKQRGIGMLQLLVILGALMALVVGLSYKTSDYFAKSQALDSDALLRLADNQLRQYIAANGRLPCPDLHVPATGLESSGCTSSDQKGYLPYKTLGMVENNYVYGEVPILYGVYNDGTINFASTSQVFIPTFADKANASKPVNNPRNIFDFCASLGLLKAKGSVDATGLSVAGQYNAVFALALPGKANRDGLAAGWTSGPTVNAQYDGLNALNAKQFELPEKPVGPTYDDRTAFRGPIDLHDYLRCEAMNNSISLLTEAVTAQQEVEDFADANDESATIGIVLNAVGIALATWEVIQDIAAIAEASEQIGIASALLATNTALCPLPPWVTCALIPVNVTALVSASIGLGLSIGAAVSAGIALGLEIAATIYYADVKARTTRPNPTYNVTGAPDSGITADRLAKLKLNYVTSRDAAKSAYTAFAAIPVPGAGATAAASQSAANVVSADIAAVTNAQLGSLLSNVLNGSSVTCSGDLTGCTKTQVPVLNSPLEYKKVSPDGTLATCIPADHTPSTWCTDNGYSQTQMSIVWSKVDTVSGAVVTCTDSAATCKANGYSAAGQPIYNTVYVKNGLSSPYSPGVISSVDAYYQALGPNQTQNADGTVTVVPAPSGDVSGTLSTSNAVVGSYSTLLAAIANFDSKNIAYKTALNWEAAKLGEYNYAVNLRDRAVFCQSAANYAARADLCQGLNEFTNRPTQAMIAAGSNVQVQYLVIDWQNTAAYQNQPASTGPLTIAGALVVYNDAVTASDTANTARTTALTPVQTAMGNAGLSSSWNPTPSTSSLCGASGCGWMTGASSSSVGGLARTTSTDVNSYLSAYETYRGADAYAAKKKTAESAAANAWSDRNSFKSAACQVNGFTPPWVGSAYTNSIAGDPATWDAYSVAALDGGRDGNNLYGANWTGSGTAIASAVSAGGPLKCSGGPTAAELQAKYCTVGGPDYNVDACKQYTAPAKSSKSAPIVQDPAGIVNILIQKGIAL